MNREEPRPHSDNVVRPFFYGGLPWWCGLLAVQVPVVVRILLLEQILVMVGREERRKKNKTPRGAGLGGGSERHRSADLTIFSRTLYQLSYRALEQKTQANLGSHSATPAGLEPVTSAVTGRRSNQLSYGAIVLTCVRQQER